MKNLSYTLKVASKKIFILSFSISFVCLVVILLILCVIPLWDSATAHSPSGKAQPFLSGGWPFFRALHLGIKFSLHPALSLFGTQQQLTHSQAKRSTFPLRKMPVFHGATSWHTIFTSSCIILPWDPARAHLPSSQKLISSSLKESCFSGLIVV